MNNLKVILLFLICPYVLAEDEELYERNTGWDSYGLHEVAVERYLLKESNSEIWIRIWDSYARSSNPLEISISIIGSNPTRAVVEIAKEKTLMMQLLELAYTADVEKAKIKIGRNDALGSLKTNRYEFLVSECKGLSKELRRLENIDIALPKPSIDICSGKSDICLEEVSVYLHPRVYEVEFEKSQRVAKFSYWGGYDELSSWAEEVRTKIQSCI